MKRLFLLVLMIFVVFGLYAGGTKEAATTGNDLSPIKTSGHIGVSVGLPLYMGELDGTYENVGLKTSRVHYVSGPPQLEALPSGAWEVGWIGITAANIGVLRYDAIIVGVAGIDNTQQILIRENSDIYKAGKGHLADFPEVYGTTATWKGKNILCEKGTLHYLNVSLMLEKFGLKEEDVNIIHMDAPSAFQAFKAGEGDVFASYGNTTLQAINLGFKVAETMNGIGAGMPAVIITTPEFAQKNPEILTAYLKGSVIAQQNVANPSNKAKSAKLYQEFVNEEAGTKLTDADALTTLDMYSFLDVKAMKDLCKTGSNGLTGLQTMYSKILDYYINLGLFNANDKDTIIKAIDTSYLNNALKDL